MFEHTSQWISTEIPVKSCCVVSNALIETTMKELRTRSSGWRESAAIWTGDKSGAVKNVYFHHQLADDKGGPLSLELPEHAKFELYQNLAKEGQTLIALLHTHPEDWVGLSWIDQQNQLSSKIGFWSIVIPNYACGDWDNENIGFHLRAERGWIQLSNKEVNKKFIIERCESENHRK